MQSKAAAPGGSSNDYCESRAGATERLSSRRHCLLRRALNREQASPAQPLRSEHGGRVLQAGPEGGQPLLDHLFVDVAVLIHEKAVLKGRLFKAAVPSGITGRRCAPAGQRPAGLGTQQLAVGSWPPGDQQQMRPGAPAPQHMQAMR